MVTGGLDLTVTVVISTYNYAEVLPFSIASALAQTHPPLEILVIGDGCTDNSAEVVAGLGDDRVRFINLQGRVGSQAGPNNEGIRRAAGEVIAYLGHDDLWFPGHLKHLVDAMADGADFVYDRALFVNIDGSFHLWPAMTGRIGPLAGSLAHRRSLAVEHNLWWKLPQELRQPTDVDFYRSARSMGLDIRALPRLGQLKISSSQRKDVYQQRPVHEQEHWTKRLQQPDLEAELGLAALLDERKGQPMTFAEQQPFLPTLKVAARMLTRMLLGRAWRLTTRRWQASNGEVTRRRLEFVGAPTTGGSAAPSVQRDVAST